MKIKEITKIIGIPILFASLCCLSPIILVLLGISTVSFATTLGNTLYYDYRWWFRGVGLLTLGLSILLYLRKSKGICTLDQAKRRRNEILNVVLVALITGVAGYVIWLYVVVEYMGKWLGFWR